MNFIREELFSPDANYTEKIIDTKFFRERKASFADSYGKFYDKLDDEGKQKLEYIKLCGYQMFYEACAENFARGFRCAVRLICDSMSNDNDGSLEDIETD